jgi:hypothetical protein
MSCADLMRVIDHTLIGLHSHFFSHLWRVNYVKKFWHLARANNDGQIRLTCRTGGYKICYYSVCTALPNNILGGQNARVMEKMNQAMMVDNHHIWRQWAERLYQRGFGDVVATFLEASGPLNLLGAQMVYLGMPLMQGILPLNQLHALANVLEDVTETRAFITILREATA